MLEIIGMAVVAWVVFAIATGVFRGVKLKRNRETGKQVRDIAVNTLGVPPAYYRHSVLNYMDEVKKAAEYLQSSGGDYSSLDWPNALAWAIYGGYRHDCDQYLRGNASVQNVLERAGVSVENINNELARDSLSLSTNSEEAEPEAEAEVETAVDPLQLLQFYQIVKIQGEECLAHWNGEHWEMDATCDSLNEMLRTGLIDLRAVQNWIDKKQTQQ
ncbi:hypothetical protein GCM10011348_15940 [Marinobacterium nitratireducens]|uniref:Uncharacterized protein n=1 Tax=Marinobacterium nitratireducens TaxID=518897 RepID=A0A918DRZ8_9GAMM|nr:hypothetical protein [Marinobacterium nitratireducens]GGO80070.1 hypothetical protein GCM10011348_15940 [Marinobacterium nitratireducens]